MRAVESRRHRLEAVIDTGFSGFVSMPIIQAFPIGLTLCGTTTVQFADGSKGNKLLALGTLAVGAVQKTGIVILQEGSASVLLGMDFIRTFNIALVMTKMGIALLDHTLLDQMMAGAQTAATVPAPSVSAPAITAEQAPDVGPAGDTSGTPPS